MLKPSQLDDKFNEHLLGVMSCGDQKTLLGLFGNKHRNKHINKK